MKPRLNYKTLIPGAYRALAGVEAYLSGCGLNRRMTRLVVLRASQINHCAFCIDMHVKELQEEGESDARIYLLNAWREAPCYSDQERAALAWTEAVTTLAPDFVPDEVFEEARRHFSEQDLANLTVAIGMINTWNRLSVSFRSVPASFAEKS